MLMHFHAYVLHILYILIFLNCFRTFLIVSFSPPHSLIYVNVSCHLSVNLLHPGTLFVPGHPLCLTLLPHTSGSITRRTNQTFLRTFLDEAFIWNAKSFYRTSPTLTYPLSFTIGVGSHYVMSRSHVHPC